MKIYSGQDGKVTYLDLELSDCRDRELPFVPLYNFKPGPWRWGKQSTALEAYQLAAALLYHVTGGRITEGDMCDFGDLVIWELPADWSLTQDEIEVWLGIQPHDQAKVIGRAERRKAK